MRICGVSFESTASVVTLIDFDDTTTIAHIPAETRKITMNDHEDDDCLRGFQQTARTFLTDNSVVAVAIRKCTSSGKYQSGAPAMKMEALLQVLDFDTALIPGKTVTTDFDKVDISPPDTVLAYQRDAFKTACVLGIKRTA